jgi:hypothetical protein
MTAEITDLALLGVYTLSIISNSELTQRFGNLFSDSSVGPNRIGAPTPTFYPRKEPYRIGRNNGI